MEKNVQVGAKSKVRTANKQKKETKLMNIISHTTQVTIHLYT